MPFDAPSSNEIASLSLHLKNYISPISSNEQHVESKTKDVSLCKNAGRSETETTCLHNVRSQLLQNIANATKCDVSCVNRRKKSSDNDCIPGPHFNRIVLLQVENNFAMIDDPNEVKCCRSPLNVT